MTSTATTAPLSQSIEPIDLNQAHNHVADELWQVLCDHQVTPWLTEIGNQGRDQGDIDTILNCWSNALNSALTEPALASDAKRVLARLDAHRIKMHRNRRVYSHTTRQEVCHRYWPTGKHEHLETENLYSMNLCVKANKFITPQTKIMSAGSCFALEIGKTLRSWGYNYFVTENGPEHLSKEQRWDEHFGRFSARYGKLFNTPSLRQLVERGFGLVALKPYTYPFDGIWRDPYRDELTFTSPGDLAKSIPSFEQSLHKALMQAEVLILTLGVNEVWSFIHDGSYLSRVPWRLTPALLQRKVLSVQENADELQRLNNVLLAHNPNIKIIVTVSPVPLLATFRADDTSIVVANCHSKSILRVAAEEFTLANKNVTYFPAYEAVLYGSRYPFKDDGRHVSEEAITRVMTMFKETYCINSD